MSFVRGSSSKLCVTAIVGVIFFISILSISISTADEPRQLPTAPETHELPYSPASFESEDGLTYIERRVRSAAVRVITNGGHGSGSYMTVGEFRVVLTAQHVASGPVGSLYQVSSVTAGEVVGARLVYSDAVHDIAVLLVPEIQTRRPMQFRVRSTRIEPGTSISYAGHPSHHSILSFRGMVSGYENDTTPGGRGEILILHSFGWPGCSGSVLYDANGYAIGILWGVSVGNVTGFPQVIEDLVWATPASVITERQIINGICTSSPRPESCQRYLEE